MANTKRVKVIKDNITKNIYESELSTYLAMGWKKVQEYNVANFDKIR